MTRTAPATALLPYAVVARDTSTPTTQSRRDHSPLSVVLEAPERALALLEEADPPPAP